MKSFIKKYIVLLTPAVFLFSCAELDEEIESGISIEKPTSVIVDEKVSSYDVLKSYSGDLILGANASNNNVSGTSMATLLETNFEQVTPVGELYPDSIVSDEGDYNFNYINDFIETAQTRGLTVYGDALVSNINQNDVYLKSTVAPYVFLTPLYPNIVDQSVVEDGSFTGWAINGNVSVEDYLGHASVKMVNGSSVGASDATSLQSPVYTVEDGAKFEVTFYLLSTQIGEGRVTFTGLQNNEPEMDWMGTGTIASTFTTKLGWNRIKFQTDDFDGSGEFSFNIELGYTANVTYYINIQGLSVVNLNGSVDNPDEIFVEAEEGDIGSEWQINDDADASAGKYLLANSAANYLTPNDAGSEPFINNYTFNANKAGTYNLWVRGWGPSGNDDSFFISVNGSSFNFSWWSLGSSSWKWVNIGTYTLTEGENVFAACIRENGYKLDRFYFTLSANEPTGKGSSVLTQEEVTLEVAEELKKMAVDEALGEYVTNVLSETGDKISAWTIVSNPFAEDGSIAVSGGSSAEGEFYWADYIGDDYVAKAFSDAKASAVSGTKLFIGETGLNTNSAKLNAVVNALNTISDIDGVAVSLPLDLDSDLNDVGDMLDDLAATGKLVYITNLCIAVEEATDESYALQSEAYKTLVNMYKSKVPAGQQFGISLSSPADDFKGLWDSGYNRKQSFAGFAVGLGAQE